jgi:hypothetical protein
MTEKDLIKQHKLTCTMLIMTVIVVSSSVPPHKTIDSPASDGDDEHQQS